MRLTVRPAGRAASASGIENVAVAEFVPVDDFSIRDQWRSGKVNDGRRRRVDYRVFNRAAQFGYRNTLAVHWPAD